MDTFANSPKSGRATWRVRRWAPVTVGFLAALALVPVKGVARQPGPSGTPTQSAAVRAQIRLEALATNDDGPTGVQRCESRCIRAVGGDAVTFLVAGNRDAPTLCDAGFSPQRSDGPAFYLWRFDTRVLAATEARTTLAVSWTRWRQGERAGSGTRTITLEPGDYHILDFVPAPDGSPSPCANLEIRLSQSGSHGELVQTGRGRRGAPELSRATGRSGGAGPSGSDFDGRGAGERVFRHHRSGGSVEGRQCGHGLRPVLLGQPCVADDRRLAGRPSR
jgi:hypothetical protein